LKATASEEARDAARERQRNDLQGNFVAQLVKRTIAPFICLLSESRRVNVTLPARYEETIEALEQGIDIGEGGNREHPGYATDDLQDGVDGSCGGGKQRLLLNQERLGQNADVRSATDPFRKDWPLVLPLLLDAKCDRVGRAAVVMNVLLDFTRCGAKAQSKPAALLGILRINTRTGHRGLHGILLLSTCG
jgi:hypothetical protein